MPPDLLEYAQRVARRCVNTPGHGRPLAGGISVAKRTCSFPGCGTRRYCRGWCIKHYRRWQRNGDPAITLLPGRDQSPEERFWVKVNKQGPIPEHRPELGPCWIWTACTDGRGYGTFNLGGQGTPMIRAHRHAFTLLGELIPDGLEPDHLCRVTACVKAVADEYGPAHLEPVTHRENILRGVKGVLTTHCPQGHPYDETNTYWSTNRLGNPVRDCRTCHRERQRKRTADGDT